MVDDTAGTTGERASKSTILLGPGASEINAALVEHGFSVITWPAVAISPAQSSATLDDAIESLFGYDWLIFVNHDAARFFLERLNQTKHEVSELDSVRVCAVGEATAVTLEQSQVHVDVVALDVTSSAIIDSMATYVGGLEHLQRLNILLPQASIGRDYLRRDFEQADARADVAIAYQTVATTDATRLTALHSLLLTASVDAVVFVNESDVSDMYRLFDTNDLGRLLRNIEVFVIDDRAAALARQRGILPTLISVSPLQDALVQALISRFCR